ncbi:hypothetical protein ACQKI4_24200, partial [Paenibacillus glucanolyticus]|uniref:hypothetical protein n=1 Tax=Paenibacillus glucanolyticus TaxID=59843 RepID=UPI003CFED8C5
MHSPHAKQPGSKPPSPRGIRRACSKELYRTTKRLKLYIPPESLKQGEELYYRKVIGNLIWIHDNHSNKKLLCEWWEKEVCSVQVDNLMIMNRQCSNIFKNGCL